VGTDVGKSDSPSAARPAMHVRKAKGRFAQLPSCVILISGNCLYRGVHQAKSFGQPSVEAPTARPADLPAPRSAGAIESIRGGQCSQSEPCTGARSGNNANHPPALINRSDDGTTCPGNTFDRSDHGTRCSGNTIDCSGERTDGPDDVIERLDGASRAVEDVTGRFDDINRGLARSASGWPTAYWSRAAPGCAQAAPDVALLTPILRGRPASTPLTQQC
jgi:hypothetical protein